MVIISKDDEAKDLRLVVFSDQEPDALGIKYVDAIIRRKNRWILQKIKLYYLKNSFKGYTMKTVLLFLLILSISAPLSANADNRYFIILHNMTLDDLNALGVFPGKYWGVDPERIFLSGNQTTLNWLEAHNLQFKAQPFDDDHESVYINYLDRAVISTSSIGIIFEDYDCVVSHWPLTDASSCRKVWPKKMPGMQSEIHIQIPDQAMNSIDSMVHLVNTDTIMGYLSRLTGAHRIYFNEHYDTIKTRYSGTEDNDMSAEYLTRILEGYGYQTEIHRFYVGSLLSFAEVDSENIWAVGASQEVFRTTDGGTTWQYVPVGYSWGLSDVETCGRDSIWISGNGGVIYFSSDGGETFSSQASPINNNLRGIHFINSSYGWIAADSCRVISTTDGGRNWNVYALTTIAPQLYDVFFIDTKNGWAVGQDGTIIHSTDGGRSWSRQESGTSERLNAVYFECRNDGWTVGDNGVNLHTTDGGNHWNAIDLGTDANNYDIDFYKGVYGAIVGENGRIFITTDGGANWQPGASGTMRDIFGVTFTNRLTGYAGGDGYIAKTTDGGRTWASQMNALPFTWKNVIATKPGLVYPGQQVILCAHYDNTSQTPLVLAPGADDNGSGSIAVVEAARIFKEVDFERTIKFCIWGGEEQWLLGSAAYASEAFARGDTIAGVYNLDLIAWDGNGDDSVEFHCGTMNSSRILGNLLVSVIYLYDIELCPEILTWESTNRSDHTSFWDYNYPAILGIEDFYDDFNPYYHTLGDNVSHIDTALFTEYTKAVVGATATLARVHDNMALAARLEPLPQGVSLIFNYPNPFNAQTTIQYSLPKSENVTIDIFDILGRKIKTLAEDTKPAGNHQAIWDASGQASGIYFYRIKAGDEVETKRMTLLK